jgi:hypothetical protein
VFCPVGEFEIFKAVVCSMPVFVMDYFAAMKAASKIGLHYESMFKDSPAPRYEYPNVPVVLPPTSFPCVGFVANAESVITGSCAEYVFLAGNILVPAASDSAAIAAFEFGRSGTVWLGFSYHIS